MISLFYKFIEIYSKKHDMQIVQFYLFSSVFLGDSLNLNNTHFLIFRAAVSDPEKNNSTIPPDVGPKQRKQMEFYNTRYAIAVKTKSFKNMLNSFSIYHTSE